MSSIADGFRAFRYSPHCETPANQTNTQHQTLDTNEISVTIGGSHHTNGNGEIEAVGAVWYDQNETRNLAFNIPGNLASPTAGELAAILKAMRTAPKHITLKLSIKSLDIIKLLTKHAPRLERLGWIQTPGAKLSQAVLAELRE
ncbi:hypothetical protein C8R48DRAFT_675019 [Suillus tomentosus]|nr:hypothetical protein C8R48DRAFT_675019 [Suillus tomentosus]